MSIKDQTVHDFGEQWLRYPSGHNEGFYGNLDGLRDTFGPLLDPSDLRGLRVAEIGSGPGRIVNILLDAGAAHVTALEPSDGFDILCKNTSGRSSQITYVHGAGEELPLENYDAIFSIGVLMCIPDVDSVMRRAHAALRDGGVFYAWLYGREGNELYLLLLNPLRRLTTRMPDKVVAGISHVLNGILWAYMKMCQAVPLPMHRHAVNVWAKYSHRQRFIVMFDQLNPAYAEYYTGDEARDLFGRNGFKNVQLYHRHGHSWAVRGTK
jgi:SAM-dependent methyltransferase